MRDFRYIEKGHGIGSLTDHEVCKLCDDFDIEANGFYALIPVTEDEFNMIKLNDAKTHNSFKEIA